MPALSKSRSSRHNLLPYLRSCSSKLSLTALSSTTSFTALFSSTSNNGSSRSLAFFGGGTRAAGSSTRDGTDTEAGKENESPNYKGTLRKAQKSKSRGNLGLGIRKAGGGAVISGPVLTPESLEHMRARFTLVPIVNEVEEADMVIVNVSTEKPKAKTPMQTLAVPPNSPTRTC